MTSIVLSAEAAQVVQCEAIQEVIKCQIKFSVDHLTLCTDIKALVSLLSTQAAVQGYKLL